MPVKTHQERLVIWVLLDTGLRVSELANLKKENIDWQTHRLTIYGKGGHYGSKTKRRIIPLSSRIQPLIEQHFSLNDNLGIQKRAIQRLVKRVANKAHINRNVTPHMSYAVSCSKRDIFAILTTPFRA